MTELTIKKSTKELIQEEKEIIINSNYQKLELFYQKTELIGTFYIKEKWDYGFWFYFIFEPSPTYELAGKEGILSEMYYDLRNKKYYIKRNFKDVNFSVRNIDSMFGFYESEEIFNFLSTENNIGMYKEAFNYLSSMEDEKANHFGRFFYRLITDHSYFEIIHKAKLKINHIKVIDKNGKNPMEIMGLSKTQWKIMNKFNVSWSQLFSSGYGDGRGSYEQRRNKPDKDVELMSLLAYIEKLEEEFGLARIESFLDHEIKYVYFENKDWQEYGDGYRNSVIFIAKKYGLSLKKLIRYIYFECDVSQGMEVRQALQYYGDYIRMVKQMRYTNFEKYPRFLKTVHDVVSRNYKVKLSEIEMELWEKTATENIKYEKTIGNYQFTIPKTVNELIQEGNAMNHCCGSYSKKVLNKNCVILFLRLKEKPDNSLVTIEIVGNTVYQARARFNQKPEISELLIIKKYAELMELEYSA